MWDWYIEAETKWTPFCSDIFKSIFLNENAWILITILLKFVHRGPINNIPALVQIMAWRRPGDKPLSGPMMVRLPTHICVTRPQWINAKTPQRWTQGVARIPLAGFSCHLSAGFTDMNPTPRGLFAIEYVFTSSSSSTLYQYQLLYNSMRLNRLKLRLNGPHFVDDISKFIFLHRNFCQFIEISQKFVPKGPVDLKSALVQVMAQHQTGKQPFFSPMMS